MLPQLSVHRSRKMHANGLIFVCMHIQLQRRCITGRSITVVNILEGMLARFTWVNLPCHTTSRHLSLVLFLRIHENVNCS